MDYPSDPSAALVGGKFTDGDSINNIPPSPDRAAYMNALYDEIRNAIVAGGENPDEAKVNQLATVIAKVMSGGKVLGEARWHQGETPPVGAMEFKGQILSRTTYSALWNALNDPDRNITWVTQAEAGARPGCWHTGDGSTTFGVPKTLGDYIRAFDSGGTVAAASVLGEWKDSEVGNHTHPSRQSSANNASAGTSGGFVISHGSLHTGNGTTGSPSNGQHEKIGGNGGAETRPRSVNWMACFWYE